MTTGVVNDATGLLGLDGLTVVAVEDAAQVARWCAWPLGTSERGTAPAVGSGWYG